jgi:hypothetical protein
MSLVSVNSVIFMLGFTETSAFSVLGYCFTYLEIVANRHNTIYFLLSVFSWLSTIVVLFLTLLVGHLSVRFR